MKMKWTYDKETGAAYLYIKDRIKKGEATKIVRVTDAIFVDFDKQGRMLGIEFVSSNEDLPIGVLRKLCKRKQS